MISFISGYLRFSFNLVRQMEKIKFLKIEFETEADSQLKNSVRFGLWCKWPVKTSIFFELKIRLVLLKRKIEHFTFHQNDIINTQCSKLHFLLRWLRISSHFFYWADDMIHKYCNKLSRGLGNALDLCAMHHSSFVWIEGVPAMHRAPIIPQHEIADLPFVEPYERSIWRSRSWWFFFDGWWWRLSSDAAPELVQKGLRVF